jgi:hypothetical protein
MARTQTTNAPVKQPTQLEAVRLQLETIRTKMVEAKLKHEDNLKKARELRELLTRVEKQVMVSEYETLANEESIVMAHLNALEAAENNQTRSKMSAVGTR